MIIIDLSRNIIKRYVAVTTPEKITSSSDTVNGTVVSEGDVLYVQIDGSSILTPVSSTIDIREGDRVLVLLKNHEAMVIGSPTSASARLEELREMGGEVTELVNANKVIAGEIVAMQGLFDELTAKDLEITGKLTANEASIEALEAEDAKINGQLTAYQADIEELHAETAKIDDLEAEVAKIETLEADNVTINNKLNAQSADISRLDADYVTINGKISAVEAEIETLDATYATIDQLEVEQGRINVLETNSLTADSAEIKNLQADVADIDTLIFGSASGTTIQTSFANAVIAQLGNAQIKSAMIDNVSASKITAGDILTNNVRVLSEDGKLLISDETIQISDNTRVRVQIGKDASNDYSINIWDASGKLMFSKGGITDAAIKDAIIRDDMVSDTANISAKKLNISSLFTEINNSTETINSNKVLIDTDAGTLDVAFVKMESDINDISEDVSTQGTALSVVQGQISSKVWQSDINTATKDLATKDSVTTLSDKYSELDQTVDGISLTVGQHTTQIANKADSSTVTAVSTKVTEVEADLDGFKTSVSNTYQTKDAMSGYSTTAQMNSAIEQSAENITSSVSKTYQTKDAMSGYSTTEQMNSAINQKADSITQTVSTTYATKTALNQTDTKAANAATAANNAQKAADDAQDTADQAVEDLGSLTTRVANAESSITQNATAISQKVSSSEFTTYQTTVTNNIATAKSQAISAAATDASTKANTAKSEAISAAASDATTKANAAKEAAIETAAEDASDKADAAKDAAISAAASDATTKADNAKNAAISAAATDATNKANAAEEAANDYTDGKIETVTKEVNTVKSTVAEHTTSLSSITSRVATTEQNITTINGNVSNLTTRMSSAEQKITDEAIIQTVSSTYATKEALSDVEDATKAADDILHNMSEQIASLVVNTSGISASVESMELTYDEKMGELDESLSALTTKVDASITPEYVEIQISKSLEEGVSKVETSTGFTFNEEGLTVSKYGSEMTTEITEDGMTIYRNEAEVLVADNEGVKAEDLHATTYLIVGGRSRFENYTRDSKPRTGCFWIG